MGGSVEQRQHVAVRVAGGGGGDLRGRQPGQLHGVVDHDGKCVLLLEECLGKGRLQRGQLGVERAQLLLVLGGELGTRAAEIFFVACQQVARLGLQSSRFRSREDLEDAVVERRIKVDRIRVLRQAGSHGTLDGLQGRVRVARGEVEEHTSYVFEGLARALHCHHGVLERGRCGVARDGIDAFKVRGHRLFESGLEIRVLDLVERREVVGKRAFGEQRVRFHGAETNA